MAHRKGPRSFLGLNNYEQLLLLVVGYIIKIGILVKQKKTFININVTNTCSCCGY